MSEQPNIASAAFLIADPTRAAILTSLLDGRARPAGELAFAAGVTAQTASSHLAKLLAGGLLAVEAQGRHRYYRLGGSHVALALECLASMGPAGTVRRKPLGREAQSLRFARCCYDHLAGRVGVALTSALQERGFLIAAAGKRFEVPSDGVEWFGAVGLDVAKLKRGRRGFARQCLDWTEREHHLAGPLGAEFMTLFCARDWLRRSKSSRAVQVTPKGWAWLEAQLGIDERSIVGAAY
ncbi:ArsR/SmtB family transcription factor [Labrys monachus]|uniref:DNA-binding transcriptional ArsR family regulator n=1 Tax=Labrys monachus TaxID=217067 RepID=A0ABU0FK89_9HYPH|nr:helix-turn-helix transcriptional regulator [Labrys monachus]MDQ0394906.1 DNA-binding transcriptional ArsR family regulator [Labrys monachus]